MSVNIETAINYMKSLKAKGITYSMSGSRTGSDGTGDCSGTIYQGLVNGGATSAGWVLNTDSMHDWLVKNGFDLVSSNKEWTMKRGDIIIFGKKGSSGGAAGHVVLAVDGTNVIHCTLGQYSNGYQNGISINNEIEMPYNMGFYVYRKGSSNNDKPAQVKWFDEVATLTVDVTDGIQSWSEPNLKSKKKHLFKKGNKIKYDKACHSNGYVWVRQPRSNNEFYYIPIGLSNGDSRTETWVKW